MPYSLVRDGDKYYVKSPHGHYLSKHPLSHEQAMKQETAVRLTELRRDHPHYAPGLVGKHKDEDHVHKADDDDDDDDDDEDDDEEEEEEEEDEEEEEEEEEYTEEEIAKIREEHIAKVRAYHSGKLDAMGLPFVPAPRDAVHKHGIIKTSDIFAPLPLPLHHYRGTGQKYSAHG